VKRRYRLLSLAVIAAVSACGGGGSSMTPGAGSHSTLPTPAPTSSPATAKVQFTIVVPARNGRQFHSGLRKPKFISPATQAVGIAVNSGTFAYFNANCPSSPCTIQAEVSAPVGADTFSVTTWDAPIGPGGPNGSQNELASGGASANVGSGLTQVGVTVNGIPASAAIALSASSAPQPMATADVSLTAFDADAYQITGSYSYAVNVGLSAPSPGPYSPAAFALAGSAISGSTSQPAVMTLSGTSNGLTQYSAELYPVDNTGAVIGQGQYFSTQCTVGTACMYTAFDSIDTQQTLNFTFGLPGATSDVASQGGAMWVAEGIRAATVDANGNVTEYPPPGVAGQPPNDPTSFLALAPTANGLYYAAGDSVLPSQPVALGVLSGKTFQEYPESLVPNAMDVTTVGGSTVIWGEDGLFALRYDGGRFQNLLFFQLCSGNNTDETTTRIAGGNAFMSTNFGADVAFVPASTTASSKCIGSGAGSIAGSGENPLTTGGAVGGMTVGSDGNVWVTDSVNAKLIRVATSGTIGAQTVFSPPQSFPGLASQPAWEAITSGSDGQLYFFDENNNVIGRFNPSTQAWAGYTAPVAFAAGAQLMTQNAIAFGPDGNLYVSMPVPAAIEVVNANQVPFDLRSHRQRIYPVARPPHLGRHRGAKPKFRYKFAAVRRPR
jgi:hypothetical protein